MNGGGPEARDASRRGDVSAGVIFDIDGTLLDSMPVWMNAGAEYLKRRGFVPEPGLGEKLFPMTMTEGARYLKDEYGLPFSAGEIAGQITRQIMGAYERDVRLKPGAKELLEGLAAGGVPFAAATSTDRLPVEKALGRLGVLGLFAAVLTSAETGVGKDKPDIYFAAASVLGVPPSAVWVFEDALYAARTARRAGFKLAAVYDESGGKDWRELSSMADYLVADARGFRDFLWLLH